MIIANMHVKYHAVKIFLVSFLDYNLHQVEKFWLYRILVRWRVGNRFWHCLNM